MNSLEGNFKYAVKDVVNSLTSADKVNINNAIWESTFDIGDITKKHPVVTGIRNGETIVTIKSGNNYDAMPASNDSCYKNWCDLPTQYGSGKWSLGKYDCRTGICMDVFEKDFNYFWGMKKKATLNPLNDPDNSIFLEYLMETIERNIMGTAWRVCYLGDTDSGNPLINNNDGFLVQLGAKNGLKIHINEDEPTGEDIYKYLQQAYEATVDSAWGDDEDVVFKMTYAMGKKFVAFLNTKADLSKYNCECVDPNAIVGKHSFTVNNLRVFGIPVEVHREIDSSLSAVGSNKKYQAVLTKKSNMQIGVSSKDSMEAFDMFYDKKDDMIYIDSVLYMGGAIPLDEYVYISN